MSRFPPTSVAVLLALLAILALAPPASSYHEGTTPPPNVTIEHPREGDTAEGLVVVEGTASAEENVFEVQVQIDDRGWHTAAGRTNWTFQWNTSEETDGEHTVSARSFDGNRYSPLDQVNVTVDNEVAAPAISVDQPPPGAQVNGTVEIRGTASSAEGSVDRVEVRVRDGAWQEAEGTGNWSYRWDTADFTPGAYEITARAVDGEGRSQNTTRVLHVVSPTQDDAGATDLTLTLESPEDGASGEDPIELAGEVEGVDGEATARVMYRIDGGSWALFEVPGGGSFEHTVDTATIPPGSHDLEVRAVHGDATSDTHQRTFEVPGDTAQKQAGPGAGSSAGVALVVVAVMARLGLVAWSRR